MMLSLLIYCYATGVFSSRRIERATWHHLAVRYLTGDTHPDHDTICKFRRENLEAVKQAFVQVLQLARRMGVLKLGAVSIDGTHIKPRAVLRDPAATRSASATVHGRFFARLADLVR